MLSEATACLVVAVGLGKSRKIDALLGAMPHSWCVAYSYIGGHSRI